MAQTAVAAAREGRSCNRLTPSIVMYIIVMYIVVMAIFMKKKPLQIYLTAEQLAALRGLAAERSVSMASIIREAVGDYLVRLPVEEDPLLDIVGLGSSELGDLAEDHDRYLAEDEGADGRSAGS